MKFVYTLLSSLSFVSGEGNLIEEQSEIINKCDPAEVGETGAVPVMIIGNNNVFEVGGVVTH